MLLECVIDCCSKQVRRSIERTNSEIKARQKDIMTKEAQYRELRASVTQLEQRLADRERLKETKETLITQNVTIDKEVAVRLPVST
jgi:predicted  nucleic acid-binding Zn-ribbon protein